MTLQDATDLSALLAVVGAVAFLERRHRRDWARPRSGRALSVAACVGALLVTTATSCLRGTGVDAFAVPGDGSIVARTSDGDHSSTPLRWAASDDGGLTWRRTTRPPELPAVPSSRACSEALGCFRVVDHEVVEHRPSESARWQTSFGYTSEQLSRMQQRGPPGACNFEDLFRAVTIVSRHDGDHVVVAMGSQGALHRSPDGQWDRVAVADRRPLALHGPSWILTLSFAMPAGLYALVLVGTVVAKLRGGRLTDLAGALPVLGATGLFGVAFLLMFFLPEVVDYTISGPVIAVLSVAIFVSSLLVFLFPHRTLLPLDRPGGPPRPGNR